MKGRGFKVFAVLAIIVAALGMTSAAFAAPLKVDACPSGDGWTKIDSDDLSLYPVSGADDYCFKFGSENSEGCTGGTSDVWPPNVDNYCGLSHWSYHMPEEQEFCEQTFEVVGEWSDWSEWFWNGEQFERTRTRTITTYDAEVQDHVCGEQTETEHEYDPACPWNPDIRSGDPACEPPPDEAGGTLSPFCGGGVNFTVDNAELYIDDFDPFTEDGSQELNTGEHSYLWVALKGFEFPDGFVTEGTFDVDKCRTPDREPKTGPESALPIGAGIAFLGSIGLAIGALRRFRKS
jgi:hypothetical protein